MTWSEYQLILTSAVRGTDFLDKAYDLIRNELMKIVDEAGIEKFLLLNYFGENKEYMIRYRVHATAEQRQVVEAQLDRLRTVGKIERWTVEDWDPRIDAANRIQHAQAEINKVPNARLPDSWRIVKYANGELRYLAKDQGDKVKEFEDMLTSIVGQFTKALVTHSERRPDCAWLTSVMMHLMLNSVTVVTNTEEQYARSLPIV